MKYILSPSRNACHSIHHNISQERMMSFRKCVGAKVWFEKCKIDDFFFVCCLQSDFSHDSTFHICFSFSFRINVYLFFLLLKLNILWNGFQSAFHWYFPFRQINMHMQFSYKCKLNVSFGWNQQWRQQQQRQYREKKGRETRHKRTLYILYVCIFSSITN